MWEAGGLISVVDEERLVTWKFTTVPSGDELEPNSTREALTWQDADRPVPKLYLYKLQAVRAERVISTDTDVFLTGIILNYYGNLTTCCLVFSRMPNHSTDVKRSQSDSGWHWLTLTVEDDNPAVSTAGLGVVSEANMVTLHARRLAVVTRVHFVATETGVSWFHSGKLRNTKGLYANHCIKNSEQTLGNATHNAIHYKSIWHGRWRGKHRGSPTTERANFVEETWGFWPFFS